MQAWQSGRVGKVQGGWKGGELQNHIVVGQYCSLARLFPTPGFQLLLYYS